MYVLVSYYSSSKMMLSINEQNQFQKKITQESIELLKTLDDNRRLTDA